MSDYQDLSSYAMMFDNSKSGGKMPKKKSASARQKAKAKGMKGAAYIALGKPAGKKTKNSGGKSSSSKGSGSSSSSKSKPMVYTGSPYATSAVTKAKGITNKAFTSPYLSAGSRSAKPIATSMSAADMKSSASIALGNPRTTQVRAKSKPATSSKSTTSTTKPKFRPNVKPLKPIK